MSKEKNSIFTDEFLNDLAKEINDQYGYKDDIPGIDTTGAIKKEEE